MAKLIIFSHNHDQDFVEHSSKLEVHDPSIEHNAIQPIMISSSLDPRYDSHYNLPAMGGAGQKKLAQSSVLIVGVGALGGSAAQALTCAGVGKLTLLDPDRVERSNLGRQPLFGDQDVHQLKVHAAKATLQKKNPNVVICDIPIAFSGDNARELINGHDVVLDCSDNHTTRYAINQAATQAQCPLVQAAVHQFEGRLAIFGFPEKACYECMFPKSHSVADCSCSQSGVFSPVPAVLGTLQASEAMKILIGKKPTPTSELIIFDLLTLQQHRFQIPRNPLCPTCSGNLTSGVP